jgi:hypothetical protein
MVRPMADAIGQKANHTNGKIVPARRRIARRFKRVTPRNRKFHGTLYPALEKLPEEEAVKKMLLGGMLIAAIATPGLAAEFYIVQDSGTKHCTIVDKRPTVKTTTVVGGEKVYTTREEASTAMKTVKVCHD